MTPNSSRPRSRPERWRLLHRFAIALPVMRSFSICSLASFRAMPRCLLAFFSFFLPRNGRRRRHHGRWRRSRGTCDSASGGVLRRWRTSLPPARAAHSRTSDAATLRGCNEPRCRRHWRSIIRIARRAAYSRRSSWTGYHFSSPRRPRRTSTSDVTAATPSKSELPRKSVSTGRHEQ